MPVLPRHFFSVATQRQLRFEIVVTAEPENVLISELNNANVTILIRYVFLNNVFVWLSLMWWFASLNPRNWAIFNTASDNKK